MGRPAISRIIFIICCLAVSILFSEAVDRNKFKHCDQSGFCKRLRNYRPDSSPFKVIVDSLNITQTGVEGALLNTQTNVPFSFLLQFLVDSTVRLRINEDNVVRHRFQPLQALVAEPQLAAYELVEQTNDHVVFKLGLNKIILNVYPFKIKCYYKDELFLVANDDGRFEFEHYRERPENINEVDNADGLWEERYHEHTDSKPYGPMAVAMDFTFYSASNVYGIPSHADSLSLKTTANTGSDPYRLYNLDVFEYELDETMALYGAVPLATGHGINHTSSVFWLNAAETWIDIDKQHATSSDSTFMKNIVNLVSGGTPTAKSQSVNVYFMSETGIVDVFLILGPSPYDTTRQYSRLTGTAPLPPYFSIGYHQCRWNYNDQDDVKSVASNFDTYDIPFDVIWLDIEYTQDKKYFTWDTVKFSEPENMISALTSKGRKLVVIIDPHIKRDNNYFLHQDATSRGYYVKKKDGSDYDGWCWPGSSGYLDFMNPEVGEYYSTRYLLDNFKGSTNDVHIWNDMNEPSVFSGPETTMPKDCVHYGQWEHRDIHNMYGFFQIMLTYEGLLKRSGGTRRPFILSRAHFAGAQRYAAIWTGDNKADWGHLRISIPMCLSSALGGISFCGADVGGFFHNPDPELLTRWYQTGAFLPFFRAHAHIDTKRREPWLFDDESMQIMRNSIRERQSMLPMWYTLWYEHTKTGAPVIRPLFMEFPEEEEVFGIDHSMLLGNSTLIRSVFEPGVGDVNVYFPGKNQIWYNKYTYEQVKTNGLKSVPVTRREIPVYYRGGSIHPLRNRIRRAAILTFNDPFTLIVALDVNGTAIGQLYIDDGESFEYREGKYIHLRFTFLNNQLMSHIIDGGDFNTKAWIERVIILGIPNVFRRAIITAEKNNVQSELDVTYDTTSYSLTIRKPAVHINQEWTISLH